MNNREFVESIIEDEKLLYNKDNAERFLVLAGLYEYCSTYNEKKDFIFFSLHEYTIFMINSAKKRLKRDNQ